MTPSATRRGALLPTLGAALVIFVCPPALRAQFAPIEPGQTITGELTPSDPVPSTRGAFRVYRFNARRGDRLTATLRSTEFDGYLRLAREVGGITDELDSDND